MKALNIFNQDEFLREFLKDPILREKYKIPEDVLENAQYGPTSGHMMIDLLQEFIDISLDDATDISRRAGKFHKLLKEVLEKKITGNKKSEG